ncbi:thiolase family protein [Sphingomonas sp. ZT3P38]|uniref:thiolase family protein n=1 Tax=Parasphingomonas zepuensis TaxID=3096161 RepID=UPI002FC9B4B5
MLDASKVAVIAGVGETPVGRLTGTNSIELHVQAAKLAIDDAGIDKGLIDGLLTSGAFLDDNIRHHIIIAENLGIYCKTLCDTLRTGGQSWCHGLQMAQWAIQAGRCRAVLLVGGDTLLSSIPTGKGLGAYTDYGAHSMEFETPFGVHVPGFYALLAARHMHEFGTTSEQLAAIAVACRRHASLNPAAQKRDPITIADVLNSRMVADPLHLLDCSLISDGGHAMLVTSLEMARDLKRTPIRLAGLGQAQSYYHMGHLATAVGAPPEMARHHDLTHTVQPVAAKQAFEEAGITPADVDVAELYDSFTITALLQLEDLGFCKKGEAGPFAEGGRLELGGELPINTHGGMLSYAHPGATGGMAHIVEAVRQLRGECGDRQVVDCEVALATNVSAVSSTHSVAVLTR